MQITSWTWRVISMSLLYSFQEIFQVSRIMFWHDGPVKTHFLLQRVAAHVGLITFLSAMRHGSQYNRFLTASLDITEQPGRTHLQFKCHLLFKFRNPSKHVRPKTEA